MGKDNIKEGIKMPYVMAYGTIGKTLEKIIQAATPDRFTQDFLATKLGIKGGSAKSVIPFLKRMSFLNSDGTPTELYNRFRNESLRKAAAAESIHQGFSVLYEMNEYVHDLNDKDLQSLIVQATGLANNSSTIRAIMGSFKEIKNFAGFEINIDNHKDVESDAVGKKNDEIENKLEDGLKNNTKVDLRLGYNINLNLPATTDIAVYNAIFKSLKDHLLS